MHRRVIPILLALAIAAMVSGETLYVPASANAEGANSTRWRTDLQVKAQGGAGAAFTVELLKHSKANTDPLSVDFSVAAGQSLGLADFIETGFGFTGTAALRITPTEGHILATSRTYNDDPSGTYGQTVPAVTEDDAIGFGDEAALIQLARSPDPTTGFRTNIGFVSLTDTRIEVVVDLFLADGTALGDLVYELKAFEYRQINDVFATAGATDVADGYAMVSTTDEDGSFITYASVVDNGSGDAVFILGQTEIAVTPAQDRLVVLESFLRDG
jgi:hypothetical protein